MASQQTQYDSDDLNDDEFRCHYLQQEEAKAFAANLAAAKKNDKVEAEKAEEAEEAEPPRKKVATAAPAAHPVSFFKYTPPHADAVKTLGNLDLKNVPHHVIENAIKLLQEHGALPKTAAV
jgi:hypothetical protein